MDKESLGVKIGMVVLGRGKGGFIGVVRGGKGLGRNLDGGRELGDWWMVLGKDGFYWRAENLGRMWRELIRLVILFDLIVNGAYVFNGKIGNYF